MKVFRRSIYAWVALLGIVFSQLAVSAYACPGQNALSPAKDSVKVMVGMPCAEMEMVISAMEQPALCLQHCEQGNQTVGSAQPLDVNPTLILLPVVPTLAQTMAASEPFLQTPALALPPYPPPLWRTARLRI